MSLTIAILTELNFPAVLSPNLVILSLPPSKQFCQLLSPNLVNTVNHDFFELPPVSSAIITQFSGVTNHDAHLKFHHSLPTAHYPVNSFPDINLYQLSCNPTYNLNIPRKGGKTVRYVWYV